MSGLQPQYADLLKQIAHDLGKCLRGNAFVPAAPADAITDLAGLCLFIAAHDSDTADRLSALLFLDTPLVYLRIVIGRYPLL